VRENFFRIYSALEYLDKYLDGKGDFFRYEAAKLLSKIERSFYDPVSPRYLWKEFTKDRDEKLRNLKLNLRERLIPILKESKREEIEKAYHIIEDLARYFLDPSPLKLEELNTRLFELPRVEGEKHTIPFFRRYTPHFLSTAAVLFPFLGGYAVYYVGVNYVGVEKGEAFIAAVSFTAILIGSIVYIIIKK